MNALPSQTRRRGGILRRLGWLSAIAMLAVSAFAPTSVSAANPQPEDTACNNIGSGGRSPDYVWVTLDSAGLTVNWATDADHFDAANYDTVTVRACVFDSDGTDQGGIDQNTENDGQQLFSWSLLGYETNPCPDSTLSFGGSADSPAVQTRKSDLIDCPAAPTPTPVVPTPTPVVPTPTPVVPTPTPVVPTPTPVVPTPTPVVPTPTPVVPTPTPVVPTPTPVVPTPTPVVPTPTPVVSTPTPTGSELPAESTNPSPTGGVEGTVGTPGVTPPSTDAIGDASTPSGNNWRIVLAALASIIVLGLVFTQPARVRRSR
jgi:hypothetical protein